MVTDTCERVTTSSQLVNLMFKWKKSIVLVKSCVKSFQKIQSARKKALHLLCKKFASESSSNSEYFDFIKITELPFSLKDKIFSMFISERLKSYSHTHGPTNLQRHFKLEIQKTMRTMKTRTKTNSFLSAPSKPEPIAETCFSLYREPIILKTSILRILALKDPSSSSKAKKAIRFKIS